MFCTKSNSLLINAAEHYMRLGYQVGVTKKKVLIDEHFSRHIPRDTWDGITIILDGLVCVDMDCFTNLGVELPPTLKERSPRGLHFFYRLPIGRRRVSKIRWQKNVDLLTRTPKSKLLYGSKREFEGHVLCSPSKGYSRLYPNTTPYRNLLPMAPNWLLDAMRE